MAEDDIYGNKSRYEFFKKNLNMFLIEPYKRKYRRGSKAKYFCRNPDNLAYFKHLFAYFESKDLSFIRRTRILQSMKFICNATEKDLSLCKREDINQIMAMMHEIYQSPKGKQTFIKDLKYIWKVLFPEKDEKGRPDETIVPYPVRHVSIKTDKSRMKLRKDKLTWDEFEKLVNYFSRDSRMQAYLALALESLARPQELLYLKIGDVELFDNYAKIYISEHGKEGCGLLQCIDSYPYILNWLNQHPLKKDRNAFIFVNIGKRNTLKQLKPKNVNQMIRKACNDLNINKPITCYSLKRNGVTIRRLRGESDMEIQHAARWTSTQQLKTYDLSSQDDAFRRELEKRGIIKPDKKDSDVLKTKICPFCNETVGFGEILCPKCRHLIDRNAILSDKNKDEQIKRLKQTIDHMNSQFSEIKSQIMQELKEEILETKNIV